MMKNRLLLTLLVGATFSALSMEVQEVASKVKIVAVGSATNKGNYRPTNEDRFFVRANDNSGCIAIFDGSAGDGLAEEAKKLLEEKHKTDSGWKSTVSVLYDCQAFAQKHFISDDPINGVFMGPSPSNCLSTATIAHLNPEGLLNVVWVGDTRAIVIEKLGTVAAATQDHKPDRPDEISRLTGRYKGVKYVKGGPARAGAKYGTVAISRAIGGLKHKPVGLVMEPQYLQKKLAASDMCVLNACDGVWDVFSNEEAAEFVKNFLQNNSEKSSDIGDLLCKALIEEALKKGSKDNVTAAVMFFEVKQEDADNVAGMIEAEQKEEELVGVWARWGNKIVCIGGPLAIFISLLLYNKYR